MRNSYSIILFQVGDFVLVELKLEEGRNVGKMVCYVAKVLEVLDNGRRLNLSFLRLRSAFSTDAFTFPPIEDEEEVTRDQVKGVLVTTKGATKRQSDLIKVSPPLDSFNLFR